MGKKIVKETVKEGYSRKPILIVLIIVMLATTYIGLSLYFSNHFISGTIINGVKADYLTVADVKQSLLEAADNYSLSITNEGEQLDTIKAAEINVLYNIDDELIEEILKKQNGFLWPLGFLNSKEYIDEKMVGFDATKLKTRVSQMGFISKYNTKTAKDATFKYINGEFVATEEELGDELSVYDLSKKLGEAVMTFKSSVDLKEDGLYVQPKIVKDSEELINLLSELNKRLNLKIEYEEGTIVSKDELALWLDADEDLNVVVDENGVAEFVDKLSDEYSTVGEPVQLKSSYGTIVNVPGGSFGWMVDKDAEIEQLVSDIKTNTSNKRSVIYVEKGADEDGNLNIESYLEVNITAQEVFLYVDGKLVLKTPCVTGNVMNGMGTHLGAFRVAYLDRNATLRGEDYETPVAFWMPFNGGEGFHDATWRSSFGGNIYKGGGSHGCVNLPYSSAETIFSHIHAGFPVFIYTTDGTGTNIVYVTNNPVEKQPAEEETPVDNAQKAQDVTNMINTIGLVTLQSEASIAEIRAAFNALPPEAQAMVTNTHILYNAEAQINILKNQMSAPTPPPVPEAPAPAPETVEPPAEQPVPEEAL